MSSLVEIGPVGLREADDHGGRRGGVPVERRGLRLQFGSGVPAHDGVDDVGLHPGVPGAARFGLVGVGGGRGEREIAAVAQDSGGQRGQLLVGAGQQRYHLFEELHGDADHLDGLPQRDPPPQILRDDLERLRRVADVALRVAHPLDEVDDRGLHHQLHAGPLRRLEVGEERQTLLQGAHRFGGQPAGVLPQSPQHRVGHGLQHLDGGLRRDEPIVGHR